MSSGISRASCAPTEPLCPLPPRISSPAFLLSLPSADHLLKEGNRLHTARFAHLGPARRFWQVCAAAQRVRGAGRAFCMLCLEAGWGGGVCVCGWETCDWLDFVVFLLLLLVLLLLVASLPLPLWPCECINETLSGKDAGIICRCSRREKYDSARWRSYPCQLLQFYSGFAQRGTLSIPQNSHLSPHAAASSA